MWMIIDARMPPEAIGKLKKLGEVVPLQTEGITYPSISGHPDIFFCPTPGGIIAAPNAPAQLIRKLQASTHVLTGENPAGAIYPSSCGYNAFVNTTYLIHKLEHTDHVIAEVTVNQLRLDVKQGYTRCNLVEAGGLYITSDKGIQLSLEAAELETMYINPHQILLPHQAHGFFGGCAALYQDLLLLTGSCKYLNEGEALRKALSARGITIHELYDGPLWDGGSILIVDPEEL